MSASLLRILACESTEAPNRTTDEDSEPTPQDSASDDDEEDSDPPERNVVDVSEYDAAWLAGPYEAFMGTALESAAFGVGTGFWVMTGEPGADVISRSYLVSRSDEGRTIFRLDQDARCAISTEAEFEGWVNALPIADLDLDGTVDGVAFQFSLRPPPALFRSSACDDSVAA